MRTLVILIAVSYCSAKPLLPSVAPWELSSLNLAGDSSTGTNPYLPLSGQHLATVFPHYGYSHLTTSKVYPFKNPITSHYDFPYGQNFGSLYGFPYDQNLNISSVIPNGPPLFNPYGFPGKQILPSPYSSYVNHYDSYIQPTLPYGFQFPNPPKVPYSNYLNSPYGFPQRLNPYLPTFFRPETPAATQSPQN